MQKNIKLFIGLFITYVSSYAASVKIPMYLTNESHTLVGNIIALDSKYGLMFKPDITGVIPDLSPGIHGFHVHENPSCDNLGMKAGGHLDPKKTKVHLGPYNSQGHLGDLPAVYVNTDGTIKLPVVAPRLTVKDILGHSLMIHNGGDNYSDDPKPLGGGGSRMICGVIKETK
ncbi:MAG: superoxide dismutase [Burkholderiales bacterium]|jgi:Cu-Zn family superoxide dismutase|nr:superoxide dismutase [Burkholderiales bacterium]